MSLGHGALILLVSTAAFLLGRNYAPLAWGLLTAEACLLGFWSALADRPLSTRIALGSLHLSGLVYCVLLAGAMHLAPLRANYDIIDVLRDVVPMFVASVVCGSFVRRRAWRLRETSVEDVTSVASLQKRQFSLGDFVKWFTFVCIAIGLVSSLPSLLPSSSLFLDEWLWRSRFAYYVEFLLGVCVPASVLTTLIFWLTFSRGQVRPRVIAAALVICTLAAALWIGIVVVLPYLLSVYYSWRFVHLQSVHIPTEQPKLALVTYGLNFPFGWSLLAFAFWVFIALISAHLSGWRMTRKPR